MCCLDSLDSSLPPDFKYIFIFEIDVTYQKIFPFYFYASLWFFFFQQFFPFKIFCCQQNRDANKTWKNCFETEERIRYDNRYDDGLEIFLRVHQCCVCLVLEWGQGKNWLILSELYFTLIKRVLQFGQKVLLRKQKQSESLILQNSESDFLFHRLYCIVNLLDQAHLTWFIGYYKMSFM
jgi:hypothetical protein